MMRRVLKAISLATLFYAAPLTGTGHLLLRPELWFVAAAAIAMFLSQPDFSTAQHRQRGATDRSSMVAILVAGMLSQVIPVIEWGYLGNGAEGTVTMWSTVLGATMIVGGLIFRICSIRHLGRYFTATVQIVDDHHLITGGPYAIVRHPSYLGAYVAIVGVGVYLHTLVGTIAAAVLMAGAYFYRIRVEETALGKVFGIDYIVYQQTTPAIVPHLCSSPLGSSVLTGLILAAGAGLGILTLLHCGELQLVRIDAGLITPITIVP